MLKFESFVLYSHSCYQKVISTYANFSISDCVVPSRFPLLSSDLIESVIAEFVHEAVLHSGRSLRVDTVDTVGVVVVLLNLREHTSYNNMVISLTSVTYHQF